MKKLLTIICLSFIVFKANAQLNPVNWTFTAKKTGDKTYELHLTATMQSDWHLYSQMQPDDAIAEPTKFAFDKNPLIILDGKIKEVGDLEKFHDAKLDLSANQYSETVDFVQKIKLKANAKTKMSGSVRFQTCNDEKCLPPKTVTFSIAL